jgi:hypothetical protein
MTDRELLEMAAKAAGIDLPKIWDHTEPHHWNPLRDDGAALRLAVKLKIDLRFPQDNDMYVDAGDCDAYTQYLIDAGNDRATATRRAIVRAAAEFGKDKQ